MSFCTIECAWYTPRSDAGIGWHRASATLGYLSGMLREVFAAVWNQILPSCADAAPPRMAAPATTTIPTNSRTAPPRLRCPAAWIVRRNGREVNRDRGGARGSPTIDEG